MWIECLFCLKCFDKLFVLILILFMKIKYINKLIRGFIGMLELFLFLIKCKDEWNILKFFFFEVGDKRKFIYCMNNWYGMVYW